MNSEVSTFPTRSLVTERAAALPSESVRHFSERLAFETDPSDLHHDLEAGVSGVVAIDTRSQEAYATAHIPGAISLPHREMSSATTAHLRTDGVYVTYCWGPGCNASTKGALHLGELGFAVKELIGGLEYWGREGYPVRAGNTP
ncbi:MAG TPA: rhodanese-like domain-containing protein [Opitutaceae bacterium]|jgi:rhodanese-related sulfurtransferase